MAKYQKYAEYQDAGVEWLKEIPKNWFIGDLRRGIDFLTDFEANGSFADVKANVKLDSEEKFAWYVRATDLQNQRFEIVEGNRTVDSKAYSFLNKTALYGGELLVAKRGEIGKVYLMPEISCRATLAPNLYLIRLNNLLYPKYTFYWFLSLYGKPQLELADKSTTIGALYKDDVKACRMLYPSYVEQTNIGNFLDHETAKIDSLIEKQQQLIQLLKEKRQAVISHAVTKGLDPRVKMKDSGVEWLGEVPEHWGLVPLKYLCSFSGGGTPSKDNLSYWTDGDIPWVSPKDMKTFWIKETQDYITEKAIKESSTNMVEPNSLLMVVRSGILQRTIPIAINKVPVTMNQDMKALKFVNRVLVEYIADLIHGNTSELLLEWSKEGATVESIEHEYLANSIVPVPPIEEQQAITTLVAKKMDVYRELTCKAESQILLLQERRTALISAAVTGKIDVRNWQNPTEAKMEFSA